MTLLRQRYKQFSKTAGLRTEYERTEVAGFREKTDVANKAKSGIMETNESKEKPDMTGTPVPAPAPKAPAKRTFEDVTEEYLEAATPDSHTVQDLHSYVIDGATYTVDGHDVVLDYSAHEKEIAELLERELGGEIFMVPRVNNPEGISTPDYLFRGKAYDLKTLGSEVGKNAIFNRVKKARRQAKSFVVDVTQAQLEETFIDEQLQKIYRMKETTFVDEVIIVNSNQIVKIVKRA